MTVFQKKIVTLINQQKKLFTKKNMRGLQHNGIYQRWLNPVITAEHVPVSWRYDFDEKNNPQLLERMGINATFNAGAIYWKNKYLVVVRVEANDRKSFFAVAESDNGIDNFCFWDYPVTLPQTDQTDTNVYDMRLTAHDDGYIYGVFCTERKDKLLPDDSSAAQAKCGVARTKDFLHWERLADLISPGAQQRNVVLHSEFVDGKYAFYTRPQHDFMGVGGSGGIAWGLSDSIENAEIKNETIIDAKCYHTIKEVKNGQGPAPLKTEQGWLHLAHGVRKTAAGLRYVLYMFMTALDRPWVVIYQPAGHLLAPQSGERVGDVSNVVFSNGWIVNEKRDVFIYYASSDTRLHIATSTLDLLIDYVVNSPRDTLSSASNVVVRKHMNKKNRDIIKGILG
ncbi:MAG: glycosidase [Spongiibacteraceae bacterium]|nr:glycosidase [Spongiibacteraceae bacterium]